MKKKTVLIITLLIAVLLAVVGYSRFKKAQEAVACAREIEIVNTDGASSTYSFSNSSGKENSFEKFEDAVEYCTKNRMSAAEERQLLEAANKYATGHSAVKFDLIFSRRINNWIIFQVTPKSNTTDNGQLFMEKVDGVWIGRAIGTAFPDLYKEHPELFK